MSDEPIVIDVRKQFVGAEPRRAAGCAGKGVMVSGATPDVVPTEPSTPIPLMAGNSRNLGHEPSAEMPTVPIPIQARDPDEDIPPDVGAILIGIVVLGGLFGGITWAVFHWLVR